MHYCFVNTRVMSSSVAYLRDDVSYIEGGCSIAASGGNGCQGGDGEQGELHSDGLSW